MSKPFAADYAVFVFFLLDPVVEWLWLWPRLARASEAGVRSARIAHYWRIVAVEWIFALYVLALWVVFRRPWDGLFLGHSSVLRLGLGLAFALAAILFLWRQQKLILARPKLIERVRKQMSFMGPLLPRTDAERYSFWFLAITAGVCEEILFRGFLLGFLRAWLGIIAAMLISSIVFGLAHIYQGFRHAPRTALVGLFFAVMVVLTKSLWPAILIHAAIDLHSGEMAFGVNRAAPTESTTPPAAGLLPGKSS